MTSDGSGDFDYGPVEFILVGFEGTRPDAGVIAAISDLIESETLNLLDLVIVSRGLEGDVSVVEIEDETDRYGFGSIELEASGIAADDDILEFAEQLPPGTSAALAVIELLWAKHLATKLARSGGFVIHSDRVPAPVVNAALAAIAAQD